MKIKLFVLLLATFISLHERGSFRSSSRPNIFGGYDYRNRYRTIRTIPNIHQGYNYYYLDGRFNSYYYHNMGF